MDPVFQTVSLSARLGYELTSLQPPTVSDTLTYDTLVLYCAWDRLYGSG